MPPDFITFRYDFHRGILLGIGVYMYMYVRKKLEYDRELGNERNGTGF